MPSVEENNKKQAKKEWMRLGMMMFAESTGWIAFPVIGALFLGRWLDQKQGTEPLYFLSITAAAFIISSVGIGMTGVKYLKRIEKAEGLEQGRKEEALRKQDNNESRDKS